MRHVVAADAVRHRCHGCAARWRWAVCLTCGEMGTPFEWDEAWTCGACGTTSRSWWRLDDAERTGSEIAQRRRGTASLGLLPWAAAAVGLIVVALLGTLLLMPHDSPAARRRAEAANICDRFQRVRSDSVNGVLGRGAVVAELGRLAADARVATRPVASAAAALLQAAPTSMGNDEYLTAEATMTSACS